MTDAVPGGSGDRLPGDRQNGASALIRLAGHELGRSGT